MKIKPVETFTRKNRLKEKSGQPLSKGTIVVEAAEKIY